MKKIIVILFFMIALNFGFVFFGTMGFFPHGPQGVDVTTIDPLLFEYDLSRYTAANFVIDILLFTGLAAMGAIVSNFLRINAFAMIMFTELFWWPFSKTIGVFWSISEYTPDATMVVAGFISIFTILMIVFYLFTMVEYSRSDGGM